MKTKYRNLLIAVALGGTAISGVAVAEAMAPHGMMRADSNGDGIVQRSEFFALADKHFARLDSNGDGTIGATEMRGPRMARLDANGDGAVTKAEFASQESEHFKRLDTNGDKQITDAELAAGHERMRGEDGPRGSGGMHDRHGMRGGPDGGRMGHMMLQRTDTNEDGRVSRDEMRAQADMRFAKLDTNADGFIDKAEMDAQRDKMRARFEQMRERRGGPGGDMPPPPPGAPAPARDAGQ